MPIMMDFLNRKKRSGHDANTLPYGKEHTRRIMAIANKVLRNLNCQGKWSDAGNNRVLDYVFQAGNFRLYVNESSPYANLTYPVFFSTPMENLNLIRSLCNQTNINTDQTKVIYTLNEEESEIDVHIVSSVYLEEKNAQAVLVRNMTDAFQWHTAFVRKFESMLDEQKKAKTDDLEASNNEFNRELFLLRQQEMRRQTSGEWRTNDTDCISLGQFLDKALSIIGITPVSLRLFAEDTTEVYTDNALEFDLARAICPTDGPVRKKAILSLVYTAEAQPGKEQWLTLQHNFEGDDRHTVWFRVACSSAPLGADRQHHGPQFTPVSVLMAYDKVSVKQWTDEFNYMWQDAVDKAAKGDTDSLSEEQKLIWMVEEPKLAELLYRGHKFFVAGRYYEALLYLENAYWRIQNSYESLSSQNRDAFFEVGYMVGFCYSELHQYTRAHYYLEIIDHLHRVKYTQEYVNAMVNMGDFRALSMVEDLLKKMEERLQDDDEPEGFLLSFVAFLRRRKAYLLVEHQRLEEAKTLLNAMLNDPACHDFAINELAYIQRMEKKE